MLQTHIKVGPYTNKSAGGVAKEDGDWIAVCHISATYQYTESPASAGTERIM